jgi:site-specific recombinase XerD
MSPFRQRVNTMPERYDQALQYARDWKLPPEAPRPRPTCDWPPENVTLLEQYAEWLAGGGHSEDVIRTIYIPSAGHVLGLALKPFPQLNLQTDLPPALEYIRAKGAGPDWLDVNRNALDKFRRFLMHTRGQLEIKARPYAPAPHTQGLPDWLVTELERYQRVQQRNWRPARLEDNIRRFWSGHLRLWRFLCEQRAVKTLPDVHRKHLYEYADHRLEVGNAVTTINADLRGFQCFMAFLQEQEYPVPQALLRIHSLKQPERLPKYLTDEQVRALRDDFEGQVKRAVTAAQRRDALLTRAAFYLLWQSGLRKSEVEELRLDDLDLPGRRLSVRNGKGMKDRTVFLTEATLKALTSYLAVRGPGPTDHVFLYRNQPIGKDLIHERLKAAGKRAGVKVHAHRLRHTTATQLLNAGCPVTSIQKFLGHKKLNTTMIYAKAHDQTVADDYYAAMSRIEQRLEIVPVEPEDPPEAAPENEELLSLTEQLAQPELSLEMRLLLVAQMRAILCRETRVSPINAIPMPVAFDPTAIACESANEGNFAALGP